VKGVEAALAGVICSEIELKESRNGNPYLNASLAVDGRRKYHAGTPGEAGGPALPEENSAGLSVRFDGVSYGVRRLCNGDVLSGGCLAEGGRCDGR
jgi:hypothetical protein